MYDEYIWLNEGKPADAAASAEHVRYDVMLNAVVVVVAAAREGKEVSAGLSLVNIRAVCVVPIKVTSSVEPVL